MEGTSAIRHFVVLIAVAVSAATAGCAHNGDTVVPVSAAADSDNPHARVAGRAAGAGGSHAPGSTGLGAGTMGVESTARIGSAR
jgi:hypothetical protein